MRPTIEEIADVLRVHACPDAEYAMRLYEYAAGGSRSRLARAAASAVDRGRYLGVCGALWSNGVIGDWVCYAVSLQLVQLGHGVYRYGYLVFPLSSVEHRDADGNVRNAWTRGTTAGDLRHAVLDRLAAGVGFPFDLEGLEVPRDPT